MTTYYKAVRPDGTDFYSGTVAWLPPDGVIPPEGWLVTHPTATHLGPYADTCLSVSTVAADCTGLKWPCRLLRVEPAGRAVRRADDDGLPHKRRSLAWRVIEELPAHEALGPNGVEVAAILERAAKITFTEARALHTAYSAAWHTSWGTARDTVWEFAQNTVWAIALDTEWHAAWYAARDAAQESAWEAERESERDDAWGNTWDAVRDAVRDAVGATLIRNLISPEHHDILTASWRSVIVTEDNQ